MPKNYTHAYYIIILSQNSEWLSILPRGSLEHSGLKWKILTSTFSAWRRRALKQRKRQKLSAQTFPSKQRNTRWKTRKTHTCYITRSQPTESTEPAHPVTSQVYENNEPRGNKVLLYRFQAEYSSGLVSDCTQHRDWHCWDRAKPLIRSSRSDRQQEN